MNRASVLQVKHYTNPIVRTVFEISCNSDKQHLTDRHFQECMRLRNSTVSLHELCVCVKFSCFCVCSFHTCACLYVGVCQLSPTGSCGWGVLRHCGSCSLYLILTVRLPGTCCVSMCASVYLQVSLSVCVCVYVLETVPRDTLSYLHLCFCLV